MKKLSFSVFSSLMLLLASTPSIAITASTSQLFTVDQQLEKQRALYDEAMTLLEKNQFRQFNKKSEQLKDYPLYPYLQFNSIKKRIKDVNKREVNAFFKNHPRSIPAQQLYPIWLNELADQKRWTDYVEAYQGRTGIDHKCYYLEGLHRTGQKKRALDQVNAIWLRGSSLPKTCDYIIGKWQQAGRLNEALIWQRTELAIEQNNMNLARFLVQKLSGAKQQEATWLLNLHRYPEKLVSHPEISSQSHIAAIIVSNAIKQLANTSPETATQQWLYYRDKLNFSEQQKRKMTRTIAANIITQSDEQALDWLLTYDSNAEDSYLLEWRIRLAIKANRWDDANRWITLLPSNLAQNSRWRYWQARALEQISHKDVTLARTQLINLSKERHYYGFLAAEHLERQYHFNHKTPDPVSDAQRAVVVNNASIQRAVELHYHKALRHARKEWQQGLKALDKQQLNAAVELAEINQWHGQAIATAIRAGQWNDIPTRFPLAYAQTFNSSANEAQISTPWLYAIARQESGFVTDARSRAGAMGLLQMLPSTAKEVAKSIDVSFRRKDLYEPKKNITLASNYLRQLMEKFDGNHIVATAAYNAGPNRIARLLRKQTQPLATDVWVETIPYRETRGYVQNVLAFMIIYGHRLGENNNLFDGQKEIVGAPPLLAVSD